jgi:hypothetical protein
MRQCCRRPPQTEEACPASRGLTTLLKIAVDVPPETEEVIHWHLLLSPPYGSIPVKQRLSRPSLVLELGQYCFFSVYTEPILNQPDP